MCRELIAVRQRTDLRGNTYLAAIELAHRADAGGTVRNMAYTLLATKIHACRRTAFRVIARLLEAKIIRCVQRRLGRAWWAINTYQFTIPYQCPKPARLSSGDRSSALDKSSAMLPHTPRHAGALALGDEIRALTRGMVWLTPGTDLYRAHEERLVRLQALRHGGGGEETASGTAR